MKIFKTQLCLLMISQLFLAGSCRKTIVTAEKETPPAPDPVSKLHVPVQMASAGLVVDLIYAEDQTRLTGVSCSDGTSYSISYKGQIPVKIETYKHEVLINFTDFWITDGLITKATQNSKSGIVYTPFGLYTLEYNLQRQLVRIINQQVNPNKVLMERVNSYLISGNVSSLSIIEPSGYVRSLQYSYDTRKGIFKNVPFAQLLFLEMDYPFFYFGINNRLSTTNANLALDNQAITYTYDIDDYPSEMTLNSKNNSQTFKISYK
ncbi:hypothetical protein [Pedobacter metabolipauper]|uniref:YD repeat-containing protein n=1 Tax=Pedobacter metabolipauper TaxID=425513 RepID=A0A4V3D0Q9_9SPHI|nr:hypothetical protein [Pedobacter metabolipauper]TDQ06988.1 hypothetical protein ATK78_4004 [Pedobacter metabolipauper]